MSTPEFTDLFVAARNGDESAFADWLLEYEPYLRRVIHLRLTDVRLRRLFETMDIYQSVAGDFLRWAGEGDGAFASREKVRNFLVTMVVNKINAKARAAKNRPVSLPTGYEPAAGDPSPSQHMAGREAAAAIRAKLSEEEAWLLDERGDGRTWRDLAAERGRNPDTLRMQYVRLIARLRREVGYGNNDHV